MTKSIDTLVPDIYQVLRNSRLGKGIELTVEQQAEIGASLAAKTARALNRSAHIRPKNTLYMSEIGKPCLRQLWYTVHSPHLGEQLLPNTQYKFLYGDYLEELTLFLAKLAGHKVSNEQETVEWKFSGWNFRGKKDAHIDGVLVDVKSASSYSFKKFKEGLDDTNDAFGYRRQLEGYSNVTGGSAQPMGFLAIDKQNGTLCWSPHEPDWTAFSNRMIRVVRAVDDPGGPPKRTFPLIPEGKSGNEKLGIECSYCSFKKECWKDSNGGYGLRAFAYARGPVFLGTVAKQPLGVHEIDLNAADSETSTESALAESLTP